MRNLFADLGLTLEANAEQVRAAYVRLRSDNHPDRQPGEPNAAAERFIAVREAYEVLKVDEARALHRARLIEHWDRRRNGLGAVMDPDKGWVMPGRG